MRNSYEGVCYRCGGVVAKNAGHFERFGKHHRKRHPDAPFTVRWLTQHAAIKHRGTEHSIWNKKEEQEQAK